MVIVLYMMEISPPCRAVLMTLKYLGLDVIKREQNMIDGDMRNYREFSKINPRATVPTIDDNGFYLWESRAIMTYLVNKYAPRDPIYPKDPKKRAIVDMMLNFDQGSLYKTQVEYLYPVIFFGETTELKKEKEYRKALSSLETALDNSTYVAGNHLTLADFSILANISLAEIYDFNFKGYPTIIKWLQRMKEELPFYKEINETPLYQFKFWFNPLRKPCDDEEGGFGEQETKL